MLFHGGIVVPGTPSRIEGIGMLELGRESLERHDRGFGRRAAELNDVLPVGGESQWRRRGELHKWNPATIAKLQAAADEFKTDPSPPQDMAHLEAPIGSARISNEA